MSPGWESACAEVTWAEVPGDHFSILREPGVDVLAHHLDAALAGSRRPAESEGGNDES